MTKRAKARAIPSRDEFFITVNRIADLQRVQATLEARRDALIQRVQARYGDKLKPIEEAIAGLIALADAYAEENRAELEPKDKKSVDLACATYGWRTGTKAVKFLRRDITEETVIKALKASGLDAYVRTVETLSKEKIIADAQKFPVDGVEVYCLGKQIEHGPQIIEEVMYALSELGLKITQTETFYVEPRVQSGTTVKAEAA